MLHSFLSTNRTDLIGRCRVKVAARSFSDVQQDELAHGISAFLDQLITTLEVEHMAQPLRTHKASTPSDAEKTTSSAMGETATLHAGELIAHGYTIEQVVHDYGDLCQAITELAFEKDEPVTVDEFHTLNRSLDNAIASAVSEFSDRQNALLLHKSVESMNERLGFLAHELRNHIHTASLALSVIKAGDVGVTGATGAILNHSLIKMRTLIDRSLAEVRMTADMPALNRLFSLAELVAEVKTLATLEALSRHCEFTVSVVDPKLGVNADRDLLLSAIGNLLQNAFKFTQHKTEVTLNAYAAADRVIIEVADKCGGLPGGDADQIFESFKQTGEDKSGLGLGLSICRRSVEAIDGTLSVRDIPGYGCIFSINLPRHDLPHPRSIADRRKVHVL